MHCVSYLTQSSSQGCEVGSITFLLLKRKKGSGRKNSFLQTPRKYQPLQGLNQGLCAAKPPSLSAFLQFGPCWATQTPLGHTFSCASQLFQTRIWASQTDEQRWAAKATGTNYYHPGYDLTVGTTHSLVWEFGGHLYTFISTSFHWKSHECKLFSVRLILQVWCAQCPLVYPHLWGLWFAVNYSIDLHCLLA